jgi:hypothetical protein
MQEISERIKLELEDGRIIYRTVGKVYSSILAVQPPAISYPAREEISEMAYSPDLRQFKKLTEFENGAPYVRIKNFTIEPNDAPYDRSAFLHTGEKVSDVNLEPVSRC